MKLDYLFSSYLWETIEDTREFSGTITCDSTYAPIEVEKNIRVIQVGRDEKYNLYVNAEGLVASSSIIHEINEVPSGKILNGGTIVCNTDFEGVVTLRHCISKGYTMHYKTNGEREFEAPFLVYEINWNRKYEEEKADTLIEWYLNGVKDSLLFCDVSNVNDKVSRKILRVGLEVHDLCDVQEQYSTDCVYIEFNDTGVLVRKVAKECGPAWSNNIALEYRNIYGRIPDKEEREKIAELLGFLMGRHLILVGDTAYCKDVVIESNMYHPHSKNTVAECSSNTRELIPVHQYHNERNNFRLFAQKLLPFYLELRDTYSIGAVLERYWLANIMPIGVNLPILAGALETLMKSWFKGKKSKTKGVYIEAKKYEQAIQEFKALVEEALKDCEYKRNILNKISNAYQMGVNDRYYIFLEELGLEYGLAEEACIKARNAFTHGDSGMEVEDTLHKTRTMYILIGRVLLKLLDYDGIYIDETLPNFPRKKITEKIN